MKNKILLPGLGKQLDFLLKTLKMDGFNILVMGSSSETIARSLAEKSNKSVNLIVEEYESLLNSNLFLRDEFRVQTSLMDFAVTDFNPDEFDLVYAQASISKPNRNKIIKEIKRILKSGGVFCVGEIVKLKKDVPQFVNDIFENSNLSPLYYEELNKYYNEGNFKLVEEVDLSKTLKEFYKTNIKQLSDAIDDLTDNEKSYYKKLLNKISHESKSYLKHGADEFIGFKTLLLQLNKEEKKI